MCVFYTMSNADTSEIMTGIWRCVSHAAEYTMCHFGSSREDILPSNLSFCTCGCLTLEVAVSISGVQFRSRVKHSRRKVSGIASSPTSLGKVFGGGTR